MTVCDSYGTNVIHNQLSFLHHNMSRGLKIQNGHHKIRISQISEFIKLCLKDNAKTSLENDNNYYFAENYFHCFISFVPADCEVSFFSISLFLLGGTHEERPDDKTKQKTLTRM